MAFETTPPLRSAEVTVHHLGQGNRAEHAARRIVAEMPGARLSSLPPSPPVPFPRGIVVAEIGDEVTRRRLCRPPEITGPAQIVAIVPDHDAGFTAVRAGAAQYVRASDLDGPALPAAATLARRQLDTAASAGPALFAEGTDGRCLSAAAFDWMLRQTTSALTRRGEVGYVLLARVLPDDRDAPTPEELSRLSTSAAARLVTSVRSADLPARLGELTFAILVEVGLSLDGANAVTARLTKRLSEPYPVGGRVISARVGVGMTTLGGEAVDTGEAILRARGALEESLRPDQRYG